MTGKLLGAAGAAFHAWHLAGCRGDRMILFRPGAALVGMVAWSLVSAMLPMLVCFIWGC